MQPFTIKGTPQEINAWLDEKVKELERIQQSGLCYSSPDCEEDRCCCAKYYSKNLTLK